MVNYEKALEACRQGKFTEDLRELYKFPQRKEVPWTLFPPWARPDTEIEGGHEG